jgi:hypothetical protein
MAVEDTRTLRSFPQQLEAELAQGRLVLVSSGRRGPWKIEIPAEHEAAAVALLEEDQSALVDELFAGEPDDSPESDPTRCPRCESSDRADLREEQGRILRAMGRPYWMKRWRCRSCGTRWR